MPDDMGFTIIEAQAPEAELPGLEVHPANPAATARAVRDLLAKDPLMFDRGGPTRLAYDQQKRGMAATQMTRAAVVYRTHDLSKPFSWREAPSGARKVPVSLSDRVAALYLEGLRGDWRLPPLDGIASAPLLSDDGRIRTTEGYDPETRLWCEVVPTIDVPATPTREQALAALGRVRHRFRTFPFADAIRVLVEGEAVSVVDLERAPGADESGFLVALLGAVCRPSLDLCPGLVVHAPTYSGAGTGKGLLARSICSTAFGRKPHAMPAGASNEEFDKRISAALMGAEPALFLDNLNATALRSDVLAAAMTERPAQVRPLGRSVIVPLNATTFVVVTGNGLSVSEDLARRFIIVDLDAGMEDPETRPFKPGFLEELEGDRGALLSDLLTIWRWGRQTVGLARGRPLGSFETWCSWVRDPLLALGCQDPVARIELAKAQDPRRQAVAEAYAAWWASIGDAVVVASSLPAAVLAVVDPQNRGRQYVAARLKGLAGTRAAGFVLVEQPPAGRWTATTYRLCRTDADPSDREGHRTHRTHRSDLADGTTPMPPMGPMPDALQEGGERWEEDL